MFRSKKRTVFFSSASFLLSLLFLLPGLEGLVSIPLALITTLGVTTCLTFGLLWLIAKSDTCECFIDDHQETLGTVDKLSLLTDQSFCLVSASFLFVGTPIMVSWLGYPVLFSSLYKESGGLGGCRPGFYLLYYWDFWHWLLLAVVGVIPFIGHMIRSNFRKSLV